MTGNNGRAVMPAEPRPERHTRRRVFHLWIGLTVVFAALLALVLPFIQGERLAFLAGVPVVVLNITLLLLALGWLAWVVFAPRRGRPAANDRRQASGPAPNHRRQASERTRS
jgi:hypothetical protein